MTNPQDSVNRFPHFSLDVQQLDYGIRNRESEPSARERAYRERDEHGFPGDLCYPLDFRALDHFVMENGLTGIFQHPPHEVRAFA